MGRAWRDGKLYILQARPETVKSRVSSQVTDVTCSRRRRGSAAAGRSVSVSAAGRVRVITDVSQMAKVEAGDCAGAGMTDHDLGADNERAAADRHPTAAAVPVTLPSYARELGIIGAVSAA